MRDVPGRRSGSWSGSRDGLDADAAGIEGALYGAGMLTAWIHPDPALTSAAVAAAEADGYLWPSRPRPGPPGGPWPTCSSPNQDLVPPAVVEAVLRSVFVADEVNGGRGRSEQAPVPAVVTPRAQYSYGLQLGARPKAAPEYIGATNRAARRRARLAELDRLIADLGRQREDLAAEGMLDLLADLGRAQQELPKTAPVPRRSAGHQAEGQRTAARTRLAGAKTPRRGHRGTGRPGPAAPARRRRPGPAGPRRRGGHGRACGRRLRARGRRPGPHPGELADLGKI